MPETLGQVIRDIRGTRSLRDFGDVIGVSYETVRGWEQNGYIPRPQHLRALDNAATPNQRKRMRRAVLNLRYGGNGSE